MSMASPTPLIGYDHRQCSPSKKKCLLPQIEHPSKRLIDGYRSCLDIRGKSADGFNNNELLLSESPRSYRKSAPLKSDLKTSKSFELLNDISENINTNYGEDRNQIRLPIFGRRPDSTRSSLDSRSKIETPRTSQLSINELELILKDKVHSQFHDIRTKFRHAAQNDPNGKIDRPAFQHLIATIFGTQKQISPSQIDQLLERINIKQSNKISFDEFIQSLSNGENNISNWKRNPISSRQEKSSKKTATQMFLILKEKVRTKNKDLIHLCPSLNGGSSSRIFKVQFHDAIIDMGYRMKDSEFDKLWDKFDTNEFKAIKSEKFLKLLSNETNENEEISKTTKENDIEKCSSPQLTNIPYSHRDSDLKTPRITTSRGQLDEDQIQKWLSHKFPRGFSELEHALERLDTKQTGTLPRERFLEQLKKFGLNFETSLLEFFLKKLDIDLALTNDVVPYQDIINIFKQKTDPTKKRINADNPILIEETRLEALERQIDKTLAKNCQRVEYFLKRSDPENTGFVTINTIRSIIEDFIEYTLRPDEYHYLIKQIPIDDYGRVNYKDYLKQILDRTSYLQEQKQQISKNPKYEFLVATNMRDKISSKELNEKKKENIIDNSYDYPRIRSIDELSDILKYLIRNRSKDIEEEFRKIDRGSYGELTQDLLYNLFKHLHLQPEITRDEVDLIWNRCHLKQDGTLDFYQFIREFGYSKHSAHYPNARQHPPRKGDSDLVLTSNKLYGDSILVHSGARNLIRNNWDQLRREFAELDPYRTGYVQPEEFDEILIELCPAINQDDLYLIKTRLQTQNDPRMNYIRFLTNYAPRTQSIALFDESNRNSLSTIDERSPRTGSDRLLFTQVCLKLRRKLSDSYKQLRRSLKQHDKTNTGIVSLKIFKDILNQYQCSLNDEEFYTLISQLDTRLDGSINYNYFLQQYIKNI